MPDVSWFSALIAGVLTFLAPCTLPVLPAFIGYLTGVKPTGNTRLRALMSAVGFSLGFTTVFVVFGMLSASIGVYLEHYRNMISFIGGVIVIAMGVSMFGLFSLPSFSPSLGGVIKKVHAHGAFGAMILGGLFAVGWSPCLGPILGTILILAAGTGSALAGGWLLFMFSIGFSIPFILLALFVDKLNSKLLRFSAYGMWVNRFGGSLLILIGTFLLFGDYAVLSQYISRIADITTNEWVMNHL